MSDFDNFVKKVIESQSISFSLKKILFQPIIEDYEKNKYSLELKTLVKKFLSSPQSSRSSLKSSRSSLKSSSSSLKSSSSSLKSSSSSLRSDSPLVEPDFDIGEIDSLIKELPPLPEAEEFFNSILTYLNTNYKNEKLGNYKKMFQGFLYGFLERKELNKNGITFDKEIEILDLTILVGFREYLKSKAIFRDLMDISPETEQKQLISEIPTYEKQLPQSYKKIGAVAKMEDDIATRLINVLESVKIERASRKISYYSGKSISSNDMNALKKLVIEKLQEEQKQPIITVTGGELLIKFFSLNLDKGSDELIYAIKTAGGFGSSAVTTVGHLRNLEKVGSPNIYSLSGASLDEIQEKIINDPRTDQQTKNIYLLALDNLRDKLFTNYLSRIGFIYNEQLSSLQQDDVPLSESEEHSHLAKKTIISDSLFSIRDQLDESREKCFIALLKASNEFHDKKGDLFSEPEDFAENLNKIRELEIAIDSLSIRGGSIQNEILQDIETEELNKLRTEIKKTIELLTSYFQEIQYFYNLLKTAGTTERDSSVYKGLEKQLQQVKQEYSQYKEKFANEHRAALRQDAISIQEKRAALEGKISKKDDEILELRRLNQIKKFGEEKRAHKPSRHEKKIEQDNRRLRLKNSNLKLQLHDLTLTQYTKTKEQITALTEARESLTNELSQERERASDLESAVSRTQLALKAEAEKASGLEELIEKSTKLHVQQVQSLEDRIQRGEDRGGELQRELNTLRLNHEEELSALNDRLSESAAQVQELSTTIEGHESELKTRQLTIDGLRDDVEKLSTKADRLTQQLEESGRLNEGAQEELRHQLSEEKAALVKATQLISSTASTLEKAEASNRLLKHRVDELGSENEQLLSKVAALNEQITELTEARESLTNELSQERERASDLESAVSRTQLALKAEAEKASGLEELIEKSTKLHVQQVQSLEDRIQRGEDRGGELQRELNTLRLNHEEELSALNDRLSESAAQVQELSTTIEGHESELKTRQLTIDGLRDDVEKLSTKADRLTQQLEESGRLNEGAQEELRHQLSEEKAALVKATQLISSTASTLEKAEASNRLLKHRVDELGSENEQLLSKVAALNEQITELTEARESLTNELSQERERASDLESAVSRTQLALKAEAEKASGLEELIEKSTKLHVQQVQSLEDRIQRGEDRGGELQRELNTLRLNHEEELSALNDRLSESAAQVQELSTTIEGHESELKTRQLTIDGLRDDVEKLSTKADRLTQQLEESGRLNEGAQEELRHQLSEEKAALVKATQLISSTASTLEKAEASNRLLKHRVDELGSENEQLLSKVAALNEQITELTEARESLTNELSQERERASDLESAVSRTQLALKAEAEKASGLEELIEKSTKLHVQQVQSLEDRIQRGEDRGGELQRELNTLRLNHEEELSALNDRLSESAAQVQELSTTIEGHESELKTRQLTIDGLRDDVEKLSTKADRLTQQLEESGRLNEGAQEELRHQLSEEKAALVKATQLISSTASTLEKAEASNRLLKHRVDELGSENEQLLSKVAALNEQITELTEARESLTNELSQERERASDLESAVSRTQLALKAEAEKASGLEELIEKSTKLHVQQVQSLEDRIQRGEDRGGELQRELNTLRLNHEEELSALNDRLSESAAQVQELSTTIEGHESELKIRQLTIDGLRDDVEKLSTKADRLTQQLEESGRLNEGAQEELRHQLSEEKAALVKATQLISSTASTLEKAEASNRLLKHRVDELGSENEQLLSKVAALNEQITELTEARESLTNELSQERERASDLESAVSRTQLALKAEAEKASGLEELIEKSTKLHVQQVQSLEDRIQRGEDRGGELQRELNTLRLNHEEELSALNDRLSESAAQVQELSTTIEGHESELKTRQLTIDGLRDDVEKLSTKADRLTQQLEESGRLNEGAQEELRHQLSEEKAALVKATQLASSTASTLEKAEASNRLLKHRVDELGSENERLSSQVSSLETQQRDLQSAEAIVSRVDDLTLLRLLADTGSNAPFKELDGCEDLNLAENAYLSLKRMAGITHLTLAHEAAFNEQGKRLITSQVLNAQAILANQISGGEHDGQLENLTEMAEGGRTYAIAQLKIIHSDLAGVFDRLGEGEFVLVKAAADNRQEQIELAVEKSRVATTLEQQRDLRVVENVIRGLAIGDVELLTTLSEAGNNEPFKELEGCVDLNLAPNAFESLKHTAHLHGRMLTQEAALIEKSKQLSALQLSNAIAILASQIQDGIHDEELVNLATRDEGEEHAIAQLKEINDTLDIGALTEEQYEPISNAVVNRRRVQAKEAENLAIEVLLRAISIFGEGNIGALNEIAGSEDIDALRRVKDLEHLDIIDALTEGALGRITDAAKARLEHLEGLAITALLEEIEELDDIDLLKGIASSGDAAILRDLVGLETDIRALQNVEVHNQITLATTQRLATLEREAIAALMVEVNSSKDLDLLDRVSDATTNEDLDGIGLAANARVAALQRVDAWQNIQARAQTRLDNNQTAIEALGDFINDTEDARFLEAITRASSNERLTMVFEVFDKSNAAHLGNLIEVNAHRQFIDLARARLLALDEVKHLRPDESDPRIIAQKKAIHALTREIASSKNNDLLNQIARAGRNTDLDWGEYPKDTLNLRNIYSLVEDTAYEQIRDAAIARVEQLRIERERKRDGYSNGDRRTYLDILDEDKNILRKMKFHMDSIGKVSSKIQKELKALGGMTPYYWFNPAFQGFAKKNATEMEAHFNELASGCNTMVAYLKPLRCELKEQLASIPADVSALSKEQKGALQDRKKLLERYLQMVERELSLYAPVYTMLNGNPRAEHIILNDGLSKTIQKAKTGQGSISIFPFRTSIENYKMDERNGHFNKTYSPKATAVSGTNLQNKGERYATIESIQQGYFREHTINGDNPGAAGCFIEETPASFSKNQNKFSYIPHIKLTINKFPEMPAPGSSPALTREAVKGRIDYSLAMACQLLSGLTENPSPLNPILLNGYEKEELQYIWTALMIVGKEVPFLKFDHKAIKVISSAFNEKEELGTLYGFSKNSCYTKNFKPFESYIDKMLEGMKDISKHKFGYVKEREQVKTDMNAVTAQFKNNLKQTIDELREENDKGPLLF